MNYFFIAPREGLLPASDFLQKMRSSWPQVQVKEVFDPADAHVVEFKVPMRHSRVYGSLNRKGDAIVFWGDIRDCAEFALWCRALIPVDETAILCDESMSGELEVDASTTLADITQAFSR